MSGVALTVTPPARRQVALAGAQRLQGHAQCHQRRRARRVHRDRGALQTERVRDSSRGDTRGLSGKPETFDGLRCSVCSHAVTLGVHAGEHAGSAASQPSGFNPRTLQGFPGQLQQHPLLRIHRQCLTGRDAEERGVEVGHPVHKAASAGVAGSRDVRVRVVQARQIPAPVGGELGQYVATFRQHFPQGRRATRSRPDSGTTFRRSRFGRRR